MKPGRRGAGRRAAREVVASAFCVGLLALVAAGQFGPALPPGEATSAMPAPAGQATLGPLPAAASQAEHGAQVFILVCQDCHGDRGQGLTDEWRATWDPQDQNCWKSKCHAGNHPPDGFSLPHVIPPVVSQAVVDRFATAGDLHAFIQKNMPWYDPGSLKEDEYWQVTAYLMQINGIRLEGRTLNAATAYQVPLKAAAPASTPKPAAAQTTGPAWGLALAGVLVGGLAGLGWIWRRRAARLAEDTHARER